MRKTLLFLGAFFLLLGGIFCIQGSYQSENQDDVFVVIPHHNLVNAYIERYYQEIDRNFGPFENIVLISPNHFTDDTLAQFPEDSEYCYQNACIFGKSFHDLTKKNIATFEVHQDSIETVEHGIGNHFGFVTKYFPSANTYSLIIPGKQEIRDREKILQALGGLSEKTLFIASVDFSHHVPEEIAYYHDLQTISLLNSNQDGELEVDCPNCLLILRSLANQGGQFNFHTWDRTSSQDDFGGKYPFENTTHIYGYYSDSDIIRLSQTQEAQEMDSFIKDGALFGILFGDAHLGRNLNNTPSEEYLRCFYSHADLEREPRYWHNRILYGLDVRGLNFESSLSTNGNCESDKGDLTIVTPQEKVELLGRVGFNLFNISNNHFSDCRDQDLEQQKALVSSFGIQAVGTPDNSQQNPYMYKKGNAIFTFLSWNDIGQQVNIADVASEIREHTLAGEVVIVQFHWGYEYETTQNQRQKDLAYAAVDNGARLVIGHHPHVLQGEEIYKGIPIYYSLGNFLFDQNDKETNAGMAVAFGVSRSKTRATGVVFEKEKNTYAIDCNSFRKR